MENMNNTVAIVKEWNGLAPQEQINFITACALKIIKAQPTGTWYEINEVVNEAWLRVTDNLTADKLTAINERRAAQGKAPTTLAGIVYRAARASIAAISYSDKKHAAASVRAVKDEDGQESDYIDTMTASEYDTETAAILCATLERFAASRDEIDQQIIGGMVDGLTERELADIVGISNVAVHKRITKIRVALASIL